MRKKNGRQLLGRLLPALSMLSLEACGGAPESDQSEASSSSGIDTTDTTDTTGTTTGTDTPTTGSGPTTDDTATTVDPTVMIDTTGETTGPGEEMGPVRLLGVGYRPDETMGNAVLYDVDPLTGEALNGRETGAENVLLGLTRMPDGRLLSLTDAFGVVNGVNVLGGLVELDLETGATTLIGPLGPDVVAEGDLDYNPADGRLYALTSAGGLSDLLVVDPQTGAGTLVGALPDGDASAMAFSADGRLFVLDTTYNFPTTAAILLEIDPATGAPLTSVTTNVALGNVAGMDFNPVTGVLYVADGGNDGTDMVYTLDTTTGILTVVGDTKIPGFFSGLAGLAFVPAT